MATASIVCSNPVTAKRQNRCLLYLKIYYLTWQTRYTAAKVNDLPKKHAIHILLVSFPFWCRVVIIPYAHLAWILRITLCRFGSLCAFVVQTLRGDLYLLNKCQLSDWYMQFLTPLHCFQVHQEYFRQWHCRIDYIG